MYRNRACKSIVTLTGSGVINTPPKDVNAMIKTTLRIQIPLTIWTIISSAIWIIFAKLLEFHVQFYFEHHYTNILHLFVTPTNIHFFFFGHHDTNMHIVSEHQQIHISFKNTNNYTSLLYSTPHYKDKYIT